MNSERQNPPTPLPLILLFFIVSITVIVFGILYYNYHKKTILAEKQQELSAINDLKIRQITQWRLDRIGNAKFLAESNLLQEKSNRFLNESANIFLRENIIQILRSLTENFDYKNVLLLDTVGNVMLAYPDQDAIIGDHLGPMLPGIIKNREIVLTDLHVASSASFVHLDLVVPLISSAVNDTLVIGLLAMRIDPQKILYPLIQSWPTPSKSAETLLVRREGDEIVFLNELRHQSNTELNLRKSLVTQNLPAALAAHGIQGTINGIDYRNVSVIAAMKKVPETPWFMVSKIDRSEVFSDLNKQMRMVLIILLLFILSLGLFLGFQMRDQRVRYYREKYIAELNHLALVKHFDYILKFANDIILLIDKDLTIVEANDRALETYMYEREELIGMKLSGIRAPETLSQISEQIRNVNENESATFETFHKRKDNSVFPIEISSRVVNIEGSKYYQSIGRDITDRKIAEDTLKESEGRFRKIFEESPFPMNLTGKDFYVLRANLSFCKMLGYGEEELKSLTFKNFTHPDYIADDEVSMMRLVAEEIPVYQTEKRYVCKDGSVIWGLTTVSIIRNNKGEVQLFLVMVDDITSRKESEVALERSYSLIKATLESTEDGILVVDTSGMIVLFNQKFIEMWRIPQEVIDSGYDINVLLFVKEQVSNPADFVENVRQLYAKPEATISDILEFRDGRFFERYSQPQKINGKSVGRVWSFRDITEKKRAESEILAAKEKAEESDRLKTAFLHNVSHEIRTPMNAIIGFSTLLNEPELSEPNRHQYVDIIFQSSNQLLSIINDIVDIANIESGQVKINLRKINLNSSLRNLNEQFNLEDRVNKVPTLLSNGLPDEESYILTDGTKLIQILSNLINNSIKFTHEGQIDFGYLRKGNYLEFFVKDTGIGIPPDHVNKIFDRFYQVDVAMSRQFGGTGLGLSICKAYVELLGGKIWLNSYPGKGSQFSFTIPYLID